MHKCVRCGRAAASLQEINDGCPCGSKVFVFNREAVEASIAGEEVRESVAQPVQIEKQEGGADGAARSDGSTAKPENIGAKPASPENGGAGKAESALPSARLEGNGSGKSEGGKAPDSYFARMAFTDEDVENIKVVTEGVFSIDLNALSRDPVVLKDEEGVYYVRIPFEEGGKRNSGKK